MERIKQPQREAIAEALQVIGCAFATRLSFVHFLCVDPIWVGLHGDETTADGRSYRNTAHCAYPIHTTDHSTTVVLPTPELPWIIVHELGHALHNACCADHVAIPITEYARTNAEEAFAEFFVGRFYHYGDADAYYSDGATIALLDALA